MRTVTYPLPSLSALAVYYHNKKTLEPTPTPTTVLQNYAADAKCSFAPAASRPRVPPPALVRRALGVRCTPGSRLKTCTRVYNEWHKTVHKAQVTAGNETRYKKVTRHAPNTHTKQNRDHISRHTNHTSITSTLTTAAPPLQSPLHAA